MARAVLLVCVVAAVVSVSAASKGEAVNQADKPPFSFDDIFDSSLRAKYYPGGWAADGNVLIYRDDDTGDVMEWDVETDIRTRLMASSHLEAYETGTYYVSADRKYVLIKYDINRVWRHSYTGRYKIFDIENATTLDFPNSSELKDKVIHYANWGPRAAALAFVHENDLYYQADPNAAPDRITHDGQELFIYNGIPDWNYEEDVLSEAHAHYWSPEGTSMLFVKFNDTDVPVMEFPIYGEKTDWYPEMYRVTYPKAGDIRGGQPGPNDKVTLHILRTDNPTVPMLVEPPLKYQNEDHYYVRAEWVDEDHVLITWTNRLQNESITTICDFNNCTQNHKYTSAGWIEVAAPKPLFDTPTSYLTILPKPVVGQGDWRHLARLDTTPNAEPDWLTSGQEEILHVAGYNSATSTVFYYSTNGDPTERHLMAASTSVPHAPACLTCDFGADICRHISASFSKSGEYYILTCRGPGVPYQQLWRATDNTKVQDLVMNEDVITRLAARAMPTRVFEELALHEDPLKGHTEVFFPPGYQAGNGKKYRFLQYVYSGPNSQRVSKAWPMGSNTNNWLMYLKSTHNIVVSSTDGRGTKARGEDFKFKIYRKMGKIEVEDSIAAAKEMQKKPYIDPAEKPAVFGWSYGGQTSALSLADDPDAFHCGISVAPVTSKFFYDTAYTERYMDYATPSDNEVGYNFTDVMSRAPLFHNKTFMVAHGTMDDNVHFMHFAHLVKALVEAEVQFRQQIYIDKNHYISGEHVSPHLYRALTNFLLNDCWGEQAQAPVPTTPAPTTPAPATTNPSNAPMTTTKSPTPTTTPCQCISSGAVTSPWLPLMITLISVALGGFQN